MLVANTCLYSPKTVAFLVKKRQTAVEVVPGNFPTGCVMGAQKLESAAGVIDYWRRVGAVREEWGPRGFALHVFCLQLFDNNSIG